MAKAIDVGTIGVLGGGAMGQAILAGLRSSGVAASSLAVAEPDDTRRKALAESGVVTSGDNGEIVSRSESVILAVKPQVIEAALGALAPLGDDALRKPLWLSIAAGVSLASYEQWLPTGSRIIRAMPNTPAQIGEGATAFVANAACTRDDRQRAQTLFSTSGIAWEAPSEGLLDAVTGLSGSGPAYVFVFLEALADAGVRAGLPRDAAARLAAQTVYGSARLVIESGRHPADLKDQVTSPAGTTIAGLAELEAAGFRSAVGRAVAAATARSRELGETK